jgi:multiple sugar transport system permease protein
VILSISMIFPYLWMISNSLKSVAEFGQRPYSIIPQTVTLETYRIALFKGQVARYMQNSALYTVSVVFCSLLFDSLAAYAFARHEFPGRDQAFMALLATMMLPGSVTLIPNFLVAHYLGMTNKYIGVVLPSFAGAFGIFLLRQFFLNIPGELGDAARIDGAGYFQTFWLIMLPLAKPALITLGVFQFLGEWNDFVWPLIILSDWRKYPITVGIASFREQHTTQWPLVFAASTAVSIPVAILFFFAQEYVVGGISLSGLKG